MAKIEVYSKQTCGYCLRAKALLDRKSLSYIEIDLLRQRDALADMLERSGGRGTVPQIFINDRHIGGCDDLYALERAGKLDALLQG